MSSRTRRSWNARNNGIQGSPAPPGSAARRHLLTAAALGLAGLLGPFAALAQLPPAATLLPPGFKVTVEKNVGETTVVEARKPNESFPKPHADEGIRLAISWKVTESGARTVEMLAKLPEEGPKTILGVTRSEPCGKERHLGGVLVCRKAITPWVGPGSGPDLETWELSWIGSTPKGQAGVSVGNFVGTREKALALIDEVIPKITKPG